MPKQTSKHFFTLCSAYAVLIAYFHVFMEWLFFATKPSFLSALSAKSQVLVLFIGALLPATAALLLMIFGMIIPRAIEWFVHIASKKKSQSKAYEYSAPAVLAGLLVFITTNLVDNFSYTVFNFGIISVRSHLRVLFGISMTALFIYLYRRSARFLNKRDTHLVSATSLIASILVITSIGCVALVYFSRGTIETRATSGLTDNPVSILPDIFVFSGDALQANHVWPQGDPSNGSKWFSSLGKNTASFPSFFANANRTGGSVAVAVTGKFPATTGKANSLHAFQGSHAYQHLPAILRGLGYRLLLEGSKNHVDSSAWNLRESFHEESGKSLRWSGFRRFSDRFGGRYNWEIRFTEIVIERIIGRLQHSFGFQLLPQTHLVEALKRDDSGGGDLGTLKRIRSFIDRNPGPVFVQWHTMSTRAEPQNQPPIVESFDAAVHSIVEHLKKHNRFKNSVFVIWSDHGRGYDTRIRLPLIIKWPQNISSPGNNSNVQAIDIAPTILDVLEVEAPKWMEGRSLLELPKLEPQIISVFSSDKGDGLGLFADRPVLGGLSHLQLIFCDNWYIMSLWSKAVQSGTVVGPTRACETDVLMNEDQVREILLKHLDERGYPISLIPLNKHR
jgi:hypothetical protein